MGPAESNPPCLLDIRRCSAQSRSVQFCNTCSFQPGRAGVEKTFHSKNTYGLHPRSLRGVLHPLRVTNFMCKLEPLWVSKNMLFHWTSTTCSPARPLRHVPARPFRHSRPRSLVHAEGMAQHQLSLLPRSRESQICVERAEKTVCFFPAWGVQRFLIWPNFWTGLEVLKINQWPHLPMP